MWFLTQKYTNTQSAYYVTVNKYVRDRAFSSGIIDCTGAQTLFYLTCTMISSVDLASYRISRAKDWDLWIAVQGVLY